MGEKGPMIYPYKDPGVMPGSFGMPPHAFDLAAYISKLRRMKKISSLYLAVAKEQGLSLGKEDGVCVCQVGIAKENAF